MEEEFAVILSLGETNCSMCQVYLPEGSGLMLKICLHPFCKTCLTTIILGTTDNNDIPIKCPYKSDSTDGGNDLGCTGYISLPEIEAVLTSEGFQCYKALNPNYPDSSFKTSNGIGSNANPHYQQRQESTEVDGFKENNVVHIVLSEVPINCQYCAADLKAGEGIILQNCNHGFCRNCLCEAINSTRGVRINCPIGQPDCNESLLDREIKAIVTESEFERYLEKCLQVAEAGMKNIFRCKSVGCFGMCEVDGNSRKFFLCPGCKQKNCLLCKQIHDDIPCEKFAEILRTGKTPAEALTYARNEMKTGWDQLYTFVNRDTDMVDAVLANTFTLDPSSYSHVQRKMENSYILPSTKRFACSICMEDIPPGLGVILQECLHTFCKGCIVNYICESEDPSIKCPFVEEGGNVPCHLLLTPREIRALLPMEKHDEYLNRSIKRGELVTKNSFHCLTLDCTGWCEAEETARFFWCPICGKENCIRCKAIHENSTCEEYKQKLEDDANRLVQLENERVGEAAVMASINDRTYQRCPRCNSVCHKIDGCAHVVCAACQQKFNWQ